MLDSYAKQVMLTGLRTEIEHVDWYLEKLHKDLKSTHPNDPMNAFFQRDIEANLKDRQYLTDAIAYVDKIQETK